MAGFVRVVASAYALFLAVAALGKFDTWSSWARRLAQFLPLRGRTAAGLRIGIPILEASTAVSLLIIPRVGLLAAASLLMVLGLTVGLLSFRHAGEDCGCFGNVVHTRIGWGLAIRNVGLAISAALLAALSQDARIAPVNTSGITLTLLVGVLLIIGLEWRGLSRRRAMAHQALEQV